jgi:hypothetical protein
MTSNVTEILNTGKNIVRFIQLPQILTHNLIPIRPHGSAGANSTTALGMTTR